MPRLFGNFLCYWRINLTCSMEGNAARKESSGRSETSLTFYQTKLRQFPEISEVVTHKVNEGVTVVVETWADAILC